jgi:hypothetical protein
MSTRANIIIKDSDTKLYFYRHSDGYPECTGEDLREFCKGEFCKGYTSGRFRDNVSQSAGFLVLHGAGPSQDGINERANKLWDWKCGDYEPTDGLHGDIDFLYVIDLEAKTLEIREPKRSFWDRPYIKNTSRLSIEAFKTELKAVKGGAK